MKLKRISHLVVTVFLLTNMSIMATGCAVVMATKQPDKKDLSVLEVGTARSRVIAELGAPLYSETKEEQTVDVFSFIQGYSKGAKAGRAFFHGAADIATLGLWEVVGTPAEAIADGREVKVEVKYDQESRVQLVSKL